MRPLSIQVSFEPPSAPDTNISMRKNIHPWLNIASRPNILIRLSVSIAWNSLEVFLFAFTIKHFYICLLKDDHCLTDWHTQTSVHTHTYTSIVCVCVYFFILSSRLLFFFCSTTIRWFIRLFILYFSCFLTQLLTGADADKTSVSMKSCQ